MTVGIPMKMRHIPH